MIELLQVSLENEMDLTLAYKKSIKAAELAGLSLSTQTAFATAVSEVCREIIDKTQEGKVSIQIEGANERFDLAAVINYRESEGMNSLREGLQYAKKLIPVFNHSITAHRGTIQLKLGIPRSSRLNLTRIHAIKLHFQQVEPNSPYEEIKQQNIQLFQINELKNEFLSVAGHELKTPLTILKAYIQMAVKSNSNPETSIYLQKVDAQTQKLQTMIQQLLDISKIETGHIDYNMEQVDFNSYMGDMTDLIRQLVPLHDLSVETDISADIRIDKLRIEQVIMNIAGNAAKYSPTGTKIIISTHVLPGRELLLSVKDDGIGMSEEELHKVFDKFYRVEHISKLYNGLGMGLYICSKIIHDHKGKIWIESKPGKGSIFHFTLPL